MNGETPAAQIGFGSDRCPVALDDALVVVAPSFGAAGGNAAGTFRFNEFDPTRIWKALFGRINDLHNVAVRTAGGKLRDYASHLGNWRPQV